MDHALNAGGALIAVWPITTVGTYPSWFARVAELEREAFNGRPLQRLTQRSRRACHEGHRTAAKSLALRHSDRKRAER